MPLAIAADKLNVTKGRNNAAAKLTANIKKTTMFVYQNLTIRECIITLLIIYITSSFTLVLSISDVTTPLYFI